MSRRALAAAVLSLASVVVVAAPASAGGSCRAHAGAEFMDAKGATVRMSDNCFTPTVLRVDVGDTVTFVNDDPLPHTVGGVAGTFGEIHRKIASGAGMRATFKEEGVYPYVCLFHPGMGGAIVVGDGIGATATKGATTTTGAITTRFDKADQSAFHPASAAEQTRSTASEDGRLWILTAVLAAALGAGALMLRRGATPKTETIRGRAR